jgi:hypothetical protein
MPTRDQVLQVPFVGGIDEYTDPDQLQPPGMASLENAVVRKTGRVEKREGFEYLEKYGVPGTPVDSFGGSSGPISGSVEALGVNSGKDGSRLLLAANNTLFEYVGSDANHGFRDVNRIPSCYGTLHPIDATGGEIIEVESMLDDAGAYRCTAWVLGVRNGQDLTNDRAISSQPVGTHGIYVAVQRVNDGSFVLPPTRIKNSAGTDATQVCDLRMTKATSPTDVVRHWVVTFRNEYTNICACVINANDWSLKPTGSIGTLIAPRYWRAFDITGVPNQAYMLLAVCGSDSWVSSSDVAMSLVSFDATTGAFSTVYSMPGGALDAANAYGSTTLSVHDWNRRTPRGVVLETEPSSDVIAMAVRTIYEMDTAPFYLDGKFVTMRADCGASTISFTFDSFAWLHRSAFQTEEDFSTFVTGRAEVKHTASCDQKEIGIYTDGSTVNSSTKTIITASFADGSFQPYQLALSTQGAVGNSYSGPSPYAGEDNVLISSAGSFPIPSHQYPANNKVSVRHPTTGYTPTLDSAIVDQRNVTRVQVGPAPGVIGYANTVQKCRLSTGAGVRAYAMIAFDAAGVPEEAALYCGNAPGNVFAAQSLADITLLEVTTGDPISGPWSAPVAVPPATIQVYDDFNKATTLFPQYIAFYDIGSNTVPLTQTLFDIDTGLEHCVHRWDVKTIGQTVITAISSTSAGTFSGPNGDAPFGYVSPFARNTFFEVYPWTPSSQLRRDLNAYATTGSTTPRPIWCALGGPWRMMSSLVLLPQSRVGCILTPSGDEQQCSAFLVSFGIGIAEVVTDLDPLDFMPIQYSEGVTYYDNKGVFVESMNMPRVAAVTLNCPRLAFPTGAQANVATVGAVRVGPSAGSNQVASIQYTFDPSAWRSVKQFGDYSVVNGGIVSAFDGSSCNEINPLIWPQRDLVSIAYDRPASKLFQLENQNTDYYGFQSPNFSFWYDVSYTFQFYGPLLWNINRPWFAYEAGLNSATGNIPAGANGGTIGSGSTAWSNIRTTWGGDPTLDYQSVYIDPRFQQVQPVSGQASGTGVNQASMQHYYGRYQSGYSAYNFKRPGFGGVDQFLVNWSPRKAPIDGSSATANTFQQQNRYEPSVSSGDFMVRWCYEFVDGTGRVARSAPSQACVFTICSTISYTKSPANQLNEPRPGGVVDEYRYGFFVPRMELTNRLKIASADSKRTVLQPYFTAEPYATVFYKVPFTNFLDEYQSDFTISRNATRGVVPYSGFPKQAGGQYGLVTNNLRCFDGAVGEYNGLLSQPVLYTVGGGLDNVAPPSALCMTVHQNRLVLGGADDATVVWFSKELSSTDAPGFNDALTIQIDDGGAVTGLASLESLLIIFKRGMTWLVPGDMPDDTGGAINRGYVSNTLGTPVRMPHGIGCVDHRSVVETPVGVFFKSERTIELLSRDMSITPIGLKLDDTLSYYTEVTSAIHNAKDTEVWFALRDPNNVTSIVFAVYNYTTDVWSTHDVDADAYAPPTLPMTIMNNNVYFATSWLDPLGVQPLQAVVFKQTESKFFDVTPEGRKYVVMSGVTAPISLNNVQGYQRIKRVRLMGSPIPTKSTGAPQSRNPHGMQVAAFTDYALTGPNVGFQLAQWSEAETAAVYADQNREVYEVHVKEQKGQKVTVAFAETPPADINSLSHGYGTAFSNMSFVVGLKAGLDKRITPGAKH